MTIDKEVKKNEVYMIGNAHLDPTWMWRLNEGLEAFLATCRSALDRIDETPEFIFTASSAAHYEFVEQTDPQLFTRIQEAVKKGRWSIVGGWWVEPDCNLSGGEAFIRQGLYGQKFFESCFEIICNTGFCIDSFGHNANLPQLLRHCGMSRYVFMRPEEHEKHLEDALFKWQTLSGDEVVAYRLPLHYSNFKNSVSEKLSLLSDYQLYNGKQSWMIFYGVGNHGGGPTKEQIAQIISEQSINSDFNTQFSSVDTFFDTLESTDIVLSTQTGEIQPHAIGCYSAHSKIKKLNRRAEHALLHAEKFCVLAELKVQTYKADWLRIQQAWKNILLNSFHDVLGGVAIEEACDEAISLYHESLAIASREERKSIQVLANNINTSDSIETLLIFNPQTWRVSSPVEFELWHPDSSEKGESLDSILLTDEKGNTVETQKIEPSGKIGGDRVRFVAQIEVQSFGWKKLKLERESERKKIKSNIKATEKFLSNGICGIVFEGEASENSIQYYPAQAFSDESDTWGHGIAGFTNQKGFFKVNKVTIIERGPVRGRVRVESSYGNSRMEEDFILYEGADHIEQRVYLDWRKTNFVLKLRYEHKCTDAKVFYEIPYSVIERPISEDEVPGNSWAFVQDESRGLGIINDAKSSYSSDEKFFYMTCARSPLYAHHAPPHVFLQHEQKRYQDQGEQEFSVKIIFVKKNWRAAEMPRRTLEFLQPVVTHVESSHQGFLKTEKLSFDISATNVLLTVMKRRHNLIGEGIVIRLAETIGDESLVYFSSECLSVNWKAHFNPYEIKTFLVERGKLLEINGIEDSIY